MSDRPLCYPRKRFTSAATADAAAQAIYRRNLTCLIPKRCRLCGGYHLS